MLADPHFSLSLDRRRITQTLVVVVVAIVVLHSYWWLTDHLDLPAEILWRRLSNVEAENTFPTWLSAILLASSATLTGLLALHETRSAGRYRRHWWLLAHIFLAMSIDEIAGLHEILSSPMRRLLDASGIFYFAWVVPALVFLVLLTAFYARFLVDLPPRIRRRFILAGLLFVGGAVGFEMVGAVFAQTGDRGTLAYFLATTVEETLEMAGLVVLVDTLLLYLGQRVGSVGVQLEEADESLSG